MHSTQRHNDGPRRRYARRWLPALLASVGVLAALAVPALSIEPVVAPILQIPRNNADTRRDALVEPEPLVVEARPMPLSARQDEAPLPIQDLNRRIELVRPLKRTQNAEDSFEIAQLRRRLERLRARQPSPETTWDEPRDGDIAEEEDATPALRQQRFIASRTGRLLRRQPQTHTAGKKAQAAKQLIPPSPSSIGLPPAAASSKHLNQTHSPSHVTGVVELAPFDPTGNRNASPSPSDVKPGDNKPVGLLLGESAAKAPKLVPRFGKAKPRKPDPNNVIVALAPQDPTRLGTPGERLRQEREARPPLKPLKPRADAPRESIAQVVQPPRARIPETPRQEVEESASGVNDTDVFRLPSSNVTRNVAALAPILNAREVPPIGTPVSSVSDSDKVPSSEAMVNAQKLSPAEMPDPVVKFAAEGSLAMINQLPDAEAPEEFPMLVDEESDAEELAAVEDRLKPIGKIGTSIAPQAGAMPRDYAAARFSRAGQVEHRMGTSREAAEALVMWEAPGVAYRPLYFEEVNLERHGYKVPVFQPAISAAHFFGRVPLLPYMMISEHAREPSYSLGHYRPGDYAPYSLYVPKLRIGAGTLEAAAIAGAIMVIP